MGTLHSGKGSLHGITVVVDTKGPRVFIGRCWERTDRGIELLDAGEHDGDPAAKEEYIRKAARFGVWKKHDRVLVSAADIESVRPLAEFREIGARNP